MRLLAVDPGHTTGLAYKRFDNRFPPEEFFIPPLTEMPVGFDECVDAIRANIIACAPDLIVYERFQITPATAKKTTGGSNEAIELIGVTRFLARQYAVPLEEQKPADAMSLVTDEKLKRIDWYTPGKDHARDAMRHLLLAAIRLNLVDLSLLLPRESG